MVSTLSRYKSVVIGGFVGAADVRAEGDSRGVLVFALREGAGEVLRELLPRLPALLLEEDERANFF